MKITLALATLAATLMTQPTLAQDQDAPATRSAEMAHNPVIWADVPDVAVVRVGDTYYMSSTTMHMNPGVPVMKSTDLVNWTMASYCYDTLGTEAGGDYDNPDLNLEDGQNHYSRGTWASSIRHHDGKVVVFTFAHNTGKNYVFTTDDPDGGEWERHEFSPVTHDASLFFDDDGRAYLIWGVGDLQIREIEPDFSGYKPGSEPRLFIDDVGAPAGAADNGLRGEGTQVLKKDGVYYVVNIAWPAGGMRTVVVHRSDSLDGPWEGRVTLADEGIAQGGLIDTPDGKWYALLFGDRGAVGRIPYLVPVTWEDGWPIMGVEGKVPATLDIPAGEQGESGASGIVASDDFDHTDGDDLPLAWQWNHQPDGDHWSLEDRPGWYRITTSRVDENVEQAKNTLTQRTFGPQSAAATTLDTSGMKPGDHAGLVVLMADYGYVAVEKTDDGQEIVMVRAEDRQPVEVAREAIDAIVVPPKAEFDFRDRTDKATFYYSTDGESWTAIGEPVRLRYDLRHFMGARFGLFNFATRTAGGHADFDDYRLVEPAAD